MKLGMGVGVPYVARPSIFVPGLSRTQSGLVLFDDFHAATSDDIENGWTEQEASAAVLRRIRDQESGPPKHKIEHNTNNTNDNFRRRLPAMPSDWICQVNMGVFGSTAFGYLWAAHNDGVGGNTVYVVEVSQNGGTIRILDVVGGSLQGSTATAAVNLDANDTLQVRMVGEKPGANRTIRSYVIENIQATEHALKHGDLTLKNTYNDSGDLYVPTTGDWYGVDAHETGRYWMYFICGRNIVVNNVPTGHKVQVDARTAVVESGGVVTLNVDTWELPLTTIKLLSPGDVELASLTPTNITGRTGVAPGGGIMGGDVYTVT